LDIVVPFGEPGSPELSLQAIRIVPGESLCVTGVVDDVGELTDLELVDSGRDAKGAVIELRLERGEQTRLWIRHSGDEWLYYEALALVTQQDVATSTSTRPIRPRVFVAETWNHRVRKLVVHGFRFGAAPTLAPNPASTGGRVHRDRTKMNGSVTFGFWGGDRGARLDALNEALTRDGFAPTEYVGTQGGLDLDFTLGRVRFGVALGAGGRSVQHRTTGELSIWHSEGGLTAGFDVVRYDQFHVFAATGIFGAALYVERADGLTLFPDVRPWEGNRVSFEAAMLPLDVGTDYFVPFGRASETERWILQLGMRLGWMQQLGDGSWSTDDDEPRDIAGPEVDLSGPRFRLVVGIGAQNGW
jgi:hypothetical protein